MYEEVIEMSNIDEYGWGEVDIDTTPDYKYKHCPPDAAMPDNLTPNELDQVAKWRREGLTLADAALNIIICREKDGGT